MCMVSAVGDHFRDRWIQPQPNFWPASPDTFTIQMPITRAEFDALKAEVDEMKSLLRAAKRIDELTGQPDCEMEDKLAVLRKVAEMVGVDLDDVIPRLPKTERTQP